MKIIDLLTIKIITFAVIGFVLGYGLNAFLNSNNRESSLIKQFKEYSDMIEVGLCQEVYNEFITDGSKIRKGYESFLAHCSYRMKSWRNFSIEKVVYSGSDRADIKYTYDLSVVDIDSKEWRSCIQTINIYQDDIRSCELGAPTVTERRESVETWLVEDGKWKRDY